MNKGKFNLICLFKHKWHPYYDIEMSRHGEEWFCERCDKEK